MTVSIAAKRRRIKAGDVRVGMPLSFDVFDSNDRLLLRHGNCIASESQLERLMRQGLFYGTSGNRQRAALEQPADQEPCEMARPAGREICAFRTLDECADQLDALLHGARSDQGAAGFAEAIASIATRIQHLCQFDSDAALAYVLLGRAPRYVVRQHINVAILVAAMLSRLAPGLVRTQAAVAAALTMNIGMLELQEELYWTSGPLSEEQRAALRQHPDRSAQALRERGIDDGGWLEIVAQHHEALDGSGYPCGLADGAICREARLLAVADRYNGMVMNRAYRQGMAPDEALKALARRDSRAVDPAIVGLLVTVIGVYPPGTVVRLVNKEVGVVTTRLLDLKHPIVRTFFVDPYWPFARPIKRFTSRMPQFEIAQALSRDALDCPIDPQQLWPPSQVVEAD